MSNRMNELKFLEDISFDDVVKRWEDREGFREEWQKVAKEKGFPDWRSWRMSYLKEFGLLDCKWRVYEVLPSLISAMYTGPYSSWKEFYEDREKSTFNDISEKLESNKKVKSMLESFPDESEFIGISDGERFMLIEGHHRAVAIAIALNKGIKIESEMKIALASIEKAEFDRLMVI